MKRFIFSSIALMVAVTSCTESGLIDMPEFYGNSIVFDTYVGKAPVTKAENATLNVLQSNLDNGGGAHIYAFETEDGNRNPELIDRSSTFMDGRLLYASSAWGYYYDRGDSDWVQDEVFWPGKVDLAFVAYNLAAESCISNQTSTQFDFEVMDEVADQVDLLVTPMIFVDENTGGDTSVGLEFYHLLSRVGFKVLATSSTDAQINIYSLKLCGSFPRTGRVNLASTTASIAPNTTGEYVSEYALFSVGDDDAAPFTIVSSECAEGEDGPQPVYSTDEDDRFMMIMPGSGENATIELVYNLSGETERHFARVQLKKADGTDLIFAAGKSYELILRIATQAIEFSAEVVEGGWIEQDDDIDVE